MANREPITKFKATYRFIISLIWLAGIGRIFWVMRAVPQGGWQNNSEVLSIGGTWGVVMLFALLGVFQSLFQGVAFIKFAASTVFSFMLSGSKSTLYDVYYDSGGNEVHREVSDANGGCCMDIVLGLLFTVASALVASPFVFCYNFYNFMTAWTRNTFLEGFFKLITFLLICAFLVATVLGCKWLYEQAEVVRKYQDNPRRHGLIIPQTPWSQDVAKNLVASATL